jgi:hypothetical protein
MYLYLFLLFSFPSFLIWKKGKMAQQGGEYWTVSGGQAVRTGWSCRECKKVIQKGENIKVRDGRYTQHD